MRKTKYHYTLGILLFASGIANVNAGDAASGEATYSSMGCVGCHGPAGNSMVPDMFPKLSGLEESYVAEQLRAYRSGERENATMQPMARSLTDEHIDNLAAYLATQ
jgi:cytochrome c553